MGIVIQSVANYAPWIYAICGLVALYQLYKIWAVRAERKQAVFSLEREKAINDTYSILAIALILLMTMGLTYFMSTTLAQAVEPLVAEALVPTPALPFYPTPTNTPLSVTPTPTRTATPIGAELAAPDGSATPEPDEEVAPGEGEETPQPVVEETPTPTPVPAPVVVAPNCPDQRSLLIRPGENEVVSGDLNIIGSATHENFQYFKIEAAPGANASGGWQHVGDGTAPVVSNFLTTINTRNLSNGPWTLRLVVVDMTGNFPPPCQVTVTVQN
ncbi:MAG: DUF2975 domain-containing protein [Caldilineaceae bacterium]|nr:DUF2975 domain-containing protein [Caldilineaceae bacterium]